VSVVTARHGVRPNQVLRWRKLAREGAFSSSGDGAPVFALVRLMSEAAGCWPAPLFAESTPVGVSGELAEITLSNGWRLRVAAEIEASVLHRLVATLKAAG
jgi:transposase-like protein